MKLKKSQLKKFLSAHHKSFKDCLLHHKLTFGEKITNLNYTIFVLEGLWKDLRTFFVHSMLPCFYGEKHCVSYCEIIGETSQKHRLK